ncbi:hypothetical protein Ahy_A03g012022 isoform A [Arachis hypogaea]|uniref:Uncharacterized protein n=1 Tax=Arachis hypogaea TaxID=3818 RepID=A0A445DSC6_ARAHY|nr:hypothetical protein Ahy_A03g012022 isoform A [Arachis hypogaea]
MPNVSRAKNLTRRRTLSSHLVKIFPPREENPFTLHPFTLHLSEKKTKSDRVQRRKPSAHSQLVITLSPFREENPPRVTIHRAKKTLSENPPALRESKTLTIAKIAPQSPLTPTHHSPLNTDRRSSSPSCTDRRAPPIPSRAAHTVVDLCASRRPLCAHVVDRKSLFVPSWFGFVVAILAAVKFAVDAAVIVVKGYKIVTSVPVILVAEFEKKGSICFMFLILMANFDLSRKPEKFAGPQFTSSPVTSSFQLLRSQWITIMRNDVLMEKDLFCPRYVKYYIWRDQIQFQVYKEAHQKIQSQLKAKWEEYKKLLEKARNDAEKKYDEINEQNKILHSHLEALHIWKAKKEHNAAGISFGSSSADTFGDAGLQTVMTCLQNSKEIFSTFTIRNRSVSFDNY